MVHKSRYGVIEDFENEILVVVSFKQLKSGEVFRILEDDLTPFKDGTRYLATSDPFRGKSGVLTIKCEVLSSKVIFDASKEIA